MLNRVFEVFTKEYREETEYREFVNSMIDSFKLKNKSESIDDKVKRLTDVDFVSNFGIKMGKY